MKENLGKHENKPNAIWSWNIKLAERNIDILKKTSKTVKKKKKKMMLAAKYFNVPARDFHRKAKKTYEFWQTIIF